MAVYMAISAGQYTHSERYVVPASELFPCNTTMRISKLMFCLFVFENFSSLSLSCYLSTFPSIIGKYELHELHFTNKPNVLPLGRAEFLFLSC